MNLALGFFLGILASGIAAIVYDRATRPLLRIVLDNSSRAQGQSQGNPPHEFYHLKVCNVPTRWPLSGRRPAWSCKVNLEVLNPDETPHLVGVISARWTSQPEPLVPAIHAGQPANLIDPARMMQARKVDIHSHEDQQFSVAVKFEGSHDCHIFTNESYLFPRWQNPVWRLNIGTYRLRVTAYYERGRLQSDFKLHNAGPSRDDLTLREWP